MLLTVVVLRVHLWRQSGAAEASEARRQRRGRRRRAGLARSEWRGGARRAARQRPSWPRLALRLQRCQRLADLRVALCQVLLAAASPELLASSAAAVRAPRRRAARAPPLKFRLKRGAPPRAPGVVLSDGGDSLCDTHDPDTPHTTATRATCVDFCDIPHSDSHSPHHTSPVHTLNLSEAVVAQVGAPHTAHARCCAICCSGRPCASPTLGRRSAARRTYSDSLLALVSSGVVPYRTWLMAWLTSTSMSTAKAFSSKPRIFTMSA